MSTLLDLEPIGPSERPPGRRPERSAPRFSPRRVTAALAVVAAAVMAVTVVQGDPPPSTTERAAGRLAAVAAFAEHETSFGFTIDYTLSRRGTRWGAGSSHVEGAVAPRGHVRWSETSPSQVEEVIDLGNVVYRRSGAPDSIHETQWSTDSLPAGDEHDAGAWDLPATVAGTPVFARLTANDIGRLLKAVRAASGASTPSSLRGTLPLSALYEFVPEALSAVISVEVTDGPRGRLDRLIVTMTTPRDYIDADGQQTRAVYQMRTDIRFAGWGSAGLVTAPPASQVDLTSGIDEGAVDDVGFTVLAPQDLPEGFKLTSLKKSIGPCPVIMLEYAVDPDAEGYGSGSVSLRQQAVGCAQPENWDGDLWGLGPERPFTAGRFRGVIREQPQSEEDWAEQGLQGQAEVRFDADGVRVGASGYISVPVLSQILASLAPIDLAAQPVERTMPPSS